MKKGDDKWVGPYPVTEIYPRVCRVQLLDRVRIFPIFHNYFPCCKNPEDTGLPGQSSINEIESQHIHSHVLEREDSEVKPVEK
jgi:hypothetical protein